MISAHSKHPKQSVFVTGTDTDAGKTFVSELLLLKAQQLGKSCFGLKPIAAGCELHEDPSTSEKLWKNDDALILQSASEPSQAYEIHNPIALPPAIAPHIAAKMQKIDLSVEQLLKDCESGLSQDVDFHLTEGAGGWLVPLNEEETLADFAKELSAELVLVIGMKLGCINHAMLTHALIKQSGLKLSGWVANHIDPEMSQQDQNFEYLVNHIDAPCLGRIPHSRGDKSALLPLIELPPIK